MQMQAWAVACVALAFAVPAPPPVEGAATPGDFARYEVILSRKPFGEAPAQPVAAKSQPATVPYNFFDDLNMVAIVERDRGVRVGFVNRKTQKDYFLYVGETEDGITLVSADYDEGRAIVRKGEQEGEIRFRIGLEEGPAPGPAPAGAGRPGAAPFLQNRNSYLARLRERRAKIQEAQAEQARLAEEREKSVLKGEALEKHLQQYQMEVIRKGLPPLPVPLTEEMDKQLVNEGVLPPREGAEGE